MAGNNPFFNKNTVLVESAFKIDTRDADGIKWVLCPRCGHKEEVKRKTCCSACQRYIATDMSRQTWTNHKKVHFDQVGYDPNGKDVEFKMSRQSFSWMRVLRTTGLSLLFMATCIVAAIGAFAATVGPAKFDDTVISLSTFLNENLGTPKFSYKGFTKSFEPNKPVPVASKITTKKDH